MREVVVDRQECVDEGEAGGADVVDRVDLESCRRNQVIRKEPEITLEIDALRNVAEITKSDIRHAIAVPIASEAARL